MVSQVPEATASGLTCGEIRSVEVPRERRTVRAFILLPYAEQDEECRNHFHPLCLISQQHKEGLDTFMQRAQRTARDRAKSHNEKQKQREVNE